MDFKNIKHIWFRIILGFAYLWPWIFGIAVFLRFPLVLDDFYTDLILFCDASGRFGSLAMYILLTYSFIGLAHGLIFVCFLFRLLIRCFCKMLKML